MMGGNGKMKARRGWKINLSVCVQKNFVDGNFALEMLSERRKLENVNIFDMKSKAFHFLAIFLNNFCCHSFL
jgi:hypothetical protein